MRERVRKDKIGEKRKLEEGGKDNLEEEERIKEKRGGERE